MSAHHTHVHMPTCTHSHKKLVLIMSKIVYRTLDQIINVKFHKQFPEIPFPFSLSFLEKAPPKGLARAPRVLSGNGSTGGELMKEVLSASQQSVLTAQFNYNYDFICNGYNICQVP